MPRRVRSYMLSPLSLPRLAPLGNAPPPLRSGRIPRQSLEQGHRSTARVARVARRARRAPSSFADRKMALDRGAQRY